MEKQEQATRFLQNFILNCDNNTLQENQSILYKQAKAILKGFKREWTVFERKFVINNIGLTDKELAERLNSTVGAIKMLRWRNEIKKKRGRVKNKKPEATTTPGSINKNKTFKNNK